MFEFLGTGEVSQFRVNITGDAKETRTVAMMAYSSTVLLTIDGLDSDSTYLFTVAAENDIGVGPYSEMSDEITTGKNTIKLNITPTSLRMTIHCISVVLQDIIVTLTPVVTYTMSNVCITHFMDMCVFMITLFLPFFLICWSLCGYADR